MSDKTEAVLLSVPAFCRKAGISTWKGYTLIKEKKLPAVTLGDRTLRIPAAALDQLVEQAFANQDPSK